VDVPFWMRESEPKVDQDKKWHHSTGGDMSGMSFATIQLLPCQLGCVGET
jgi:hypothetical protein